MAFQFYAVVIALLSVSCQGAVTINRAGALDTQAPMFWYDQCLDHFDALNTDTFQQKVYLDFTRYQDPRTSPVILYLCGETACRGIPNDYVQVLADRMGAAILTPEHRYYGDSIPYDQLSVEKLRFLSVEQHMEDLATIRDYVNTEINLIANLHYETDRPWIVIGVSYSGAVAAWFRVKYPHLTVGALASSAVVEAIDDFWQFDDAISRVLDPGCRNRIQRGLDYAEKIALTRDKGDEQRSADELLRKIVNGLHLHNEDYLYCLADAVSQSVQYGYRLEMCDHISSNKDDDGAEAAQQIATWVRPQFEQFFGSDCGSYDVSDKDGVDGVPGVQWLWQKCTEFGWFQIAPDQDSLRSTLIDRQYWAKVCQHVFAILIPPPVTTLNTRYGGVDIDATKIIFTNASQDPWRMASVKDELFPYQVDNDLHDIYIECDNCGHGVDLRGCPEWPNQPRGDGSKCVGVGHRLTHTREKIENILKAWVEEWLKRNN
eukprot:Clim_evm30s210 gene=Clim_evmTU30s210